MAPRALLGGQAGSSDIVGKLVGRAIYSDIASDGSGSGSSPSKSSSPNLLFAIPILLISLTILSLSRKFYRIKTAAGLGLGLALVAWALTVSKQGDGLLGSSSTTNDLSIWGITFAIFSLGTILGATILWQVGLAFLGLEAGFAFALSILLLGDEGAINNSAGRWAFVAVFSILSIGALAFLPAKWRPLTELVQSSFVGAFLFALSVDLLNNGADGLSLGLRHILDTNSHHTPYLSYTALTSSRIVIPLGCWLLAAVAGYAQYRLFKEPQPPPALVFGKSTTDLNAEESESDSDKTLSGSKEKLPSGGQTPVGDVEAGLAKNNKSVTNSATPTLNESGTETNASARQVSKKKSFTNVVPAWARGSRASSANTIPLPSLSQLIMHETQEMQKNKDATPSEPSVPQTTPTPTPTPPSSRQNGKRSSHISYTSPALALEPHDEEQTGLDPEGTKNSAENDDIQSWRSSTTTGLPLTTDVSTEDDSSSSNSISEPVQTAPTTPATSPGHVDKNPHEASTVFDAGSVLSTTSVPLKLLSVHALPGSLMGRIIAPPSSASVKARLTTDKWQTYSDAPASFDTNQKNWSFSHLYEPSKVKSFEVALCSINQDGSEQWDSNGGQNYVFSV